MDNPDPDRPFSDENIDDYLIVLIAKLRPDPHADRVLSGELVHPLIEFQRNNVAHLQTLNVP